MGADDFVWGVGNVEELEMDTITADTFEKLCEACFVMKNDIKAREDKIKDDKSLLSDMHQKVIGYLEKYKKPNHRCRLGLLSRKETTSVKLPQGENKTKFFEYLKKEGVFEDLVHINSKTLNSMYNKEIDARCEKGDVTWEMPGIEGAIITVKIAMTKAKGKTT